MLNIIESMKKLFSVASNPKTHCHFKIDFQKMDQRKEGKWLIRATKQHKDSQLQSLEHPCTPVEYPSRDYNHGIKESEGNMFNSIFKGKGQGRNHPGRCAFEDPELVTFMKPKRVMQNKK